jgi:hypothetical protein
MNEAELKMQDERWLHNDYGGVEEKTENKRKKSIVYVRNSKIKNQRSTTCKKRTASIAHVKLA